MIGACCLSKNINGKELCIEVSSEVCSYYEGIFRGERSTCPKSGFCNVSNEGKINDCKWCCGCSKDPVSFWPCCFSDADMDGICDCAESYENEFVNKCSGTGRGECNNQGHSKNYVKSGYLLKEKEEKQECFVDTRIPRACCFMLYNEFNIPLGITCQNVCSGTECDGKNLSFPPSNPSVYSSGAFCNKRLTTEQTNDYTCIQESSAILGSIENTLTYKNKKIALSRNGVCYNLKKDLKNNYSYECKTSNVSKCRGYFVPVETTGIENLCSSLHSPVAPTISEFGIPNPESMDLKTFINLKLSFGDYFRGAHYIGIYSPEASDLYGSDITNMRKKQDFFRSFRDDRGGSTAKSWALFAESKEIITPLFNNEEKYKQIESTSLHDGYYNTYGNGYNFTGFDSSTINTIKSYNRRAILGWYIPSIFELAFFANVLVDSSENFYRYITNFKHSFGFRYNYTSSSTLNSKLIYNQSLDIDNSERFGAIQVYSPYGIKTKIRLFRKIELTY
jgi:hypothetical protein